eukprot:470670-Amphidinium_carterae.1
MLLSSSAHDMHRRNQLGQDPEQDANPAGVGLSGNGAVEKCYQQGQLAESAYQGKTTEEYFQVAFVQTSFCNLEYDRFQQYHQIMSTQSLSTLTLGCQFE